MNSEIASSLALLANFLEDIFKLVQMDLRVKMEETKRVMSKLSKVLVIGSGLIIIR